MRCPYCGEPAEIEYVDNGVGLMQCGPATCLLCNAAELAFSDKPETEDEKRTGWRIYPRPLG